MTDTDLSWDRLLDTQLDGLRLQGLIGGGASSGVFAAVQLALERPVAVRVIARVEGLEDRFAEVVPILGGTTHPNLVPLYARGVHAEGGYLAMRLLKPRTLATELERGLPLGLGLRYLSEVCGALRKAHEAGLVHGRLSPRNVFVSRRSALLADLGVEAILGARPAGDRWRERSPEQWSGESPGVAADVYGVGLLAYRLGVGGGGPFEGAPSIEAAREQLAAGPPAPPERLPEPLAALAAEALSASPDRRPELGAIAQSLAHCLALPELRVAGRQRASTVSMKATRLSAPSPATPQPTSFEPRELGKYVLLDHLGSGGMGVVYKANQPALGRVVALKVLRARPGDQQEWVERLYREARAASRLRHPGIVTVHEIGEAEGQHYMAMDLVAGSSLQQLGRQRIPLERGLRWICQVAEAVQHAHDQGIVHRDLKPSNILVDERDQPHVADFGLAKDLREEALQLTQRGTVVGSPLYMSPEQAAGRADAADARTDVYALGAVLYFVASGRPPYVVDSSSQALLATLHKEPEPLRRLDPRLPRDLETVCQKAMARRPEERYPSARAFAEDVDRVRQGLAPLARRVGPLGRLLRWARRNRSSSALLALLLVGLLATPLGLVLLERRFSSRRAIAELSARARVAYVTNDLAAARRLADRLIRDHPEAPAGHFWRGRLRLDRYRGARREPLVELRGERLVVGWRAPESAEQRALREAAEADLRRVGQAPAWQRACVQGVMAALAGEHAQAATRLEEALRLEPGDLHCRGYLALVRYRQGRYREAAELARELLRTPLDASSRSLLVRAELAQALGAMAAGADPRQLLSAAARHAAALPEGADVAVRAALLDVARRDLTRRRQVAAARDRARQLVGLLERQVAREPADWQSWRMLARGLFSLGQRAQAEVALTNATRHAPPAMRAVVAAERPR